MLFKEIYDVIVVGGGPGGCVAAKECAEKGLSVLLLERHREIGVPVRCGEAVGKAGLLEFFSPDHPIVTQYVRKFKIRFIAPNGTALDLNHESEAAVLDRKIFDAGLGIAAATAGAAVMTGANVTGLLKSDGFVEGVEVELQGRRYKLKSKIVIGADGIESRVGRWAGIKTAPSFSDMESCVQYNISGKGWVTGLKCIRMELGEPDDSGRRRPVEIPGSEFDIPCDVAIIALGTSSNPLIARTTPGLEINRHNGIVADEKGVTSRPGVFAGGDVVTGAATVILAMGAGREAAKSILEYLGV